MVEQYRDREVRLVLGLADRHLEPAVGELYLSRFKRGSAKRSHRLETLLSASEGRVSSVCRSSSAPWLLPSATKRASKIENELGGGAQACQRSAALEIAPGLPHRACAERFASGLREHRDGGWIGELRGDDVLCNLRSARLVSGQQANGRFVQLGAYRR